MKKLTMDGWTINIDHDSTFDRFFVCLGSITERRQAPRTLTDRELSRLIKLDKKAWVEDMKECVAAYFAKKNFAVFSEVPIPTWFFSKYTQKRMLQTFGNQRRADVFCYSSFDYIIIETKSSWSDFSTDKKWQSYLEFANKFYFAADCVTARKILDALKDKPKYDHVGVLSFGIDTDGYVDFGFLRKGKCHYVQHSDEEIEKLKSNLIYRGSGFNYGGIPTTMFAHRSPVRLRKIVKWCLDKEKKCTLNH